MTNITELTAKLKADAIYEQLHTFMAVKPGDIRALTEALEAAEKDAQQWREVVEAFCADDADWHKLTTSDNDLISTLSLALCKQADRIAELEARTLTVKLIEPTRYDCEGYHIDEAYLTPAPDGECYDREEALTAFKSACAAASIKLQIEGDNP